MYIKKKRWFCLGLAILICLIGIHIRNIKTDVILPCISLQYDNPIVLNENLDVVELLDACDNTYVIKLSEEHTGVKKENRSGWKFLYVDTPIMDIKQLFCRIEESIFLKDTCEKMLLLYIHDSDGKKRIL